MRLYHSIIVALLGAALLACGGPEQEATAPKVLQASVSPDAPAAATATSPNSSQQKDGQERFATKKARHWILHTHRSALSFVMTKNNTVGEVGYFTGIYGEIKETGEMTIYVPLDKVDTRVDLRNQRMEEHLWEVDKFPIAKITAEVRPEEIEKVAIGQPVKLDHIKVTVDLHGHQKEYVSRLVFIKVIEDRFIVQGLEPIIINAADFGLTDGINKLRELAGLEAISEAVPVNFDFTFEGKESYDRRIQEWQKQKAIMDKKRAESAAKEASPKTPQ